MTGFADIMAHLLFNIVSDLATQSLSVNNVEMNKIEDYSYMSPNGNSNFFFMYVCVSCITASNGF